MALVHGKNAYVSLSSTLLPGVDNVAFNRSADSHDTTTLGKNSHTFQGGLLTGQVTLSGTYDDGVAGPRAIIRPLIGLTATMVHRPAGTGTGRPSDSVSVLVQAYEETEAVADMVKWSATFQMTDDITTTVQP